MEAADFPEAVDFHAVGDPVFTARVQAIIEAPDMVVIMEVIDLGIGVREDMVMEQAEAFADAFVAVL